MVTFLTYSNVLALGWHATSNIPTVQPFSHASMVPAGLASIVAPILIQPSHIRIAPTIYIGNIRTQSKPPANILNTHAYSCHIRYRFVHYNIIFVTSNATPVTRLQHMDTHKFDFIATPPSPASCHLSYVYVHIYFVYKIVMSVHGCTLHWGRMPLQQE